MRNALLPYASRLDHWPGSRILFGRRILVTRL
jgi:hypothetical protein